MHKPITDAVHTDKGPRRWPQTYAGAEAEDWLGLGHHRERAVELHVLLPHAEPDEPVEAAPVADQLLAPHAEQLHVEGEVVVGGGARLGGGVGEVLRADVV